MRSSGLTRGKYVSVFHRTSIGMYVFDPPFFTVEPGAVPSLITVRFFATDTGPGASGFLNKGAPIGFFTWYLASAGGAPKGGAT